MSQKTVKTRKSYAEEENLFDLGKEGFEYYMEAPPLWAITGKTYENREELISLGCFWDANRRLWIIEAREEDFELTAIKKRNLIVKRL